MGRLHTLGGIAVAVALAVGATAARPADPCAGYTPQEKPQNAGRDIVGKDLDALIEQGHMLFAVYDDYPPYSWIDAGKPRGVDIEIARLIAAEIGVEARFNFVGSGENLEADLRNNLWKGALIGGRIANVMMRVPYDSTFACRVEQVVFTGQYARESLAIAYRRDAYPDDPPLPAYFRFATVAVENDSIADYYLSGLAAGQLMPNIRRYADMGAVMAALDAGETSAAMGPKAQVEHGMTAALALHEPPLPGFAADSWTLGVGVNFRYRPLAYAVDDAIFAALSDGRIAAIYRDHGLSFTPPER